MRNLVLAKRRSELRGFDVETRGRDDTTLVHRVLRRMAQRDKLDGLGTAWHRQRREKAQRRFRLAAGTNDLLRELLELGTGGCARKSADAGAHGVHRSSTEQREDPVAEFAQAQASFDLPRGGSAPRRSRHRGRGSQGPRESTCGEGGSRSTRHSSRDGAVLVRRDEA